MSLNVSTVFITSSALYILIFAMVLILLALAMAPIVKLKNELQQTIDEEESQKIALQNDAKNILHRHYAKATILAQSESSLLKIAEGELCYLVADDEKLIIETTSVPTVTYILSYSKIQLFRRSENTEMITESK